MALALKNLLFTLCVPGTVAVAVPLWLAAGRAPVTGIPAVLSACALALGASIYLWCVWDFASFGRGTPLPLDAPRRLVVRGLYRFSRNPMYVGVLTLILGWALLFATPALLLYALGVATCFQGFVVLYEEPHLARVFGADYDAYRASVPRWLGPRRAPIPAASYPAVPDAAAGRQEAAER